MAAEGILANGVTEILKKLSSVVSNEITLVWDFKDELKNLQSTLNMIMAVMEDAEKKQVSKAAVRLWMEELKAIAYDAEDILDEYTYEVILCKQHQKEATVFNKVHNLFSNSKPSFVASWKLARKVKKINEKLNKIAKRKNDLGLLHTIDVGSFSHGSHELMMQNRETYSFVAEDWKIVGRENDKSNIIKMLLDEEEEEYDDDDDDDDDEEEEYDEEEEEEEGGCKHVSVIPIVGMGGLGKTTMAQLVFNDEAIQKHFQLKIWICVSDPFDIKKLYKSIANAIGIAKQYDDATTMDDIAHVLQDAFRGKKFILVLDDVWNENPADWYKFKTPLMVGRKGSKILVTTRSEKVALIMVDKFQPYPLGILKENDCWSLFKEITFGSVAGAKETPNLAEIGKEMVNRCKGLPLAVIFLGSLMRSKKKEEQWKIIRDTKLWHESRDGKNSEILPSLRLSYDYLPSHLKLCFSYCCLFPKDWNFVRQTLIHLWMAEGFLIESPGENGMSMEEIGNEYFHSLLSSFFFQDVEKVDDGDVSTCKMHDLVHDLARSVVGNHECLIVENALDIDYISEATRRLNLLVDLDDKEMLQKVLEALKKAKKLRTILVNKQRISFDIGNAFRENKKLRVLDLGWARTMSTCSSIGELKHLRYLHVYGVCFPKGMIGRLSFLQKLFEFNVGDKKQQQPRNASSVIEELEGLNHLTGDLNINHLQNVSSGTDACRANLKEKKQLGSLRLTWGDSEGDHHHGNNNHEAVLEGLEPHPNLRTLRIDGFKGSKLPRWIEKDSSCLSNLERLTLTRCIYTEQLAGFGTLPSLRCLTLEFMQSLKEWNVPVPPPPPQASTTTTTGATTTTTNCFPLLEELTICHCPLLTTITPTTTIFPCLKDLFLQDIDGRAAKTLVTNNLNYSLTSLILDRISKLVSLPSQGLMENNNTLLSLKITECPEFKGFLPPNKDEDDDGDQGGGEGQEMNIVSSSSCSSSLRYLVLNDCPALRFYPNISSLTSLRGLEIRDCKESKSLLTCLPSSFSSLEHLEYAILKIKTAKEEEEVLGSSSGRVCGGKGTTTTSSTSWTRTWILGRMF